MSFHANDWMQLAMQKLMLIVGMKAAGASTGQIKTELVQDATADLLNHIDTHPMVAAEIDKLPKAV